MAIARRCAATTAILAGLALGLAAPAGAWGPPTGRPTPAPAAPPAGPAYQMSGHYVETQSDPSTGQPITVNGQPVTNNLYFTPCGDGCASAAFVPDGPTTQAQVVNGQWTLDTVDNVNCSDGTSVPGALAAHRTWDPNTLAGTLQVTQKVAACGQPVGNTWSVNTQLNQAS